MPPARRRGGGVACILAGSFLFLQCLLPFVAGGGGGGGGGEGAACELSFRGRNAIYNYNLASPSTKYRHGVLSEDGFYKVIVNGTSLWFQLCDQMIFNHDPPKCFGCQGCGGPLRCGMRCSALVANDIGGYYVCTTIGRTSSHQVALIDANNPQKGVVVKTSSFGPQENCSLSVSIFCDSSEVQVSDSFNISGTCDYATKLRHPSGCANIIYIHGKGWGWFGTLMMIVFCLLVGYVLVGTVYRYFFLGIHGAEAVPNLEFWLSLPKRAKSLVGSVVRMFRGQARDGRGSYAPMRY